jgi:hypothetical protein
MAALEYSRWGWEGGWWAGVSTGIFVFGTFLVDRLFDGFLGFYLSNLTYPSFPFFGPSLLTYLLYTCYFFFSSPRVLFNLFSPLQVL